MANPVFVKTTDSYIAALMKVTLNSATGNTYLKQFQSFVTENGGGTTGLQKLGSALANYASTDNAAFAASVVANLGITGTSATTATTNVKALLDSYGADRGKALLQLVDVMVNLQNDTTWGSAANTFVNAVNAGYVYSANTANTSTDLTVLAAAVATTSTGTVATPGQTFTLTTDADTLSPTSAVAGTQTTSGDDTIRVVTAASLQSEDFVDAGAGKDTMNIADGAINAGAVPVIKNVEIINVTDATGATLDLLDSTGYEQLWTITTAAKTTTYDNVANLSTVFGIGASTAKGTIDINDVTASLTGSSDTLKLAVKDNNANTATITSTVDAAAIEAITIDAQGTNTSRTSTTGNNADDVVDVTAFTAIKSLTITGAGHINVDASGSTALKTVNASAATGRVTVDASAATVSGQTITTGSGNDTVTGASGSTMKTGSGNDTLISVVAGTGDYTFDGGVGADVYNHAATATSTSATFVIETSTIEDLGFDIISDGAAAQAFVSSTDVLKFVGGVAATASNYAEVTATGDGFVTARSAAQNALNGDSNLKYVVVQEATAGNSFVFFDGNGDGKLETNGADFAVQLIGIDTTEIAFGDIVAA